MDISVDAAKLVFDVLGVVLAVAVIVAAKLVIAAKSAE
jgi:hypothetical protein